MPPVLHELRWLSISALDIESISPFWYLLNRSESHFERMKQTGSSYFMACLAKAISSSDIVSWIKMIRQSKAYKPLSLKSADKLVEDLLTRNKCPPDWLASHCPAYRRILHGACWTPSWTYKTQSFGCIRSCSSSLRLHHDYPALESRWLTTIFPFWHVRQTRNCRSSSKIQNHVIRIKITSSMPILRLAKRIFSSRSFLVISFEGFAPKKLPMISVIAYLKDFPS